MQYTGINEHDTGREIYEGDIVKVRGLKEPQLVGYDTGYASFCFVYDTGEIMRRITPREMMTLRVIGNIFENPELLTPPASF